MVSVTYHFSSSYLAAREEPVQTSVLQSISCYFVGSDFTGISNFENTTSFKFIVNQPQRWERSVEFENIINDNVGVCRCPLVSVDVCWCLLVSVGVKWCPLVSDGVCWCPMVSVGVCWCLLMSVGVRWCLLVSVGVCWCTLVSVGVR